MAESALEEPLEHEIDPDVQRELLNYPGRWVTLLRSRLLAVGDSPAEVLRAAHELGEDNPILYCVPEDQQTSYFF
jgi:Family of unknown function (DUF5678)